MANNGDLAERESMQSLKQAIEKERFDARQKLVKFGVLNFVIMEVFNSS